MALPAEVRQAPQFTDQELSRVGVKAFLGITGRWGLGVEEQLQLLGDVSRATYFRWKKGEIGKLGRDTLERLSYVLGIYKALRILIPDDRQADAWMKRPNDDPFFGGRPPLERLLQGRMMDLADVRRHLDARRGIW